MRNLCYAIMAMLCVATHVKAKDWMKFLPDHLYITQVSIPGTHDSATGNGVSLAAFSQCQDISVDRQWAAGIRAYDFRPKVKDDYLNINHGIAETKLRFDEALCLLRDSLRAHPSEFVVIHCLYAQNYDEEKDTYARMLKELLGRDDLKDFFVPFRRNLTVGDMRGKILLLSRQEYAAKPYVGGFLRNWCGDVNWNAQTACCIQGPSATITGSSPLYVQDFANTNDNDGGVQKKVDAITQMLDWSTLHVTKSFTTAVWVLNFASAYKGSISTANSYRENATYANAAIIDYLKTHPAGPTGVVLMDYCVDKSDDYDTRGQELTDTLISNNYKWLESVCRPIFEVATDSLGSLYRQLGEVRETIEEKCPDVADDFEQRLAEVKAHLDSCRLDVEQRYKSWNMKWNFAIDYAGLQKEMSMTLSDAMAAQNATGIESVRSVTDARPGQIYGINGAYLPKVRKGQVVILRCKDGTVRKVMCR